MILFNILIFAVALIFLIKSSDYFIRSSASIAKKFGVSEFIIGLTLVAIGTSIPELASSVAASLKGESGIIIGNVIGSNIANIGLIAGLGASIYSIKTDKKMLKRDGYLMLFVAFLGFLFMINGAISKLEAGIFLVLYFSYLLFLFGEKPERGKGEFRNFAEYFFKFRYVKTIKRGIFAKIKKRKQGKTGFAKDFLILILSLLAIIYGAKYLIKESLFFADLLGISSTFIGISIIAVGTSLPELSIMASALKKGYGNMALGNILGSNIANILLVLGVSSMISPLAIDKITLFYTAPFMLFTSLILLGFMAKDWRISKSEGSVLFVLYILFLIVLFSGLI